VLAKGSVAVRCVKLKTSGTGKYHSNSHPLQKRTAWASAFSGNSPFLKDALRVTA
jgi:hypothetical protein